MFVDPAIGEQGDVDTAIITMKCGKRRFGGYRQFAQGAVYGYDQGAELFGSAGAVATKQRHRILGGNIKR